MELEELKRSANQSAEIEILREANDKLKIECEQKISNMKKQLDDRVSSHIQWLLQGIVIDMAY